MAAEKAKKVRRSRRVDLKCELGFSSDEIEGEAHVTNISTGGCRAESEVNVAVGLQFVVLLHLPAQSPLKIERAHAIGNTSRQSANLSHARQPGADSVVSLSLRAVW